ncbi:MAG: carboxyltransferase domain-containing protein, partial [Actinomycetota bacterium]|nr:carboxyltransferase domain-containing protein [Actinomycetota bacterium]
MRILTARDDAMLVELDDLGAAIAFEASLQHRPPRGVGELVAGARTVLVPFDPWTTTAEALAAELRSRPVVASSSVGTSDVEISAVYDGEDLAEVAALLGWSVEALVQRHSAARWTVGFMGFAPGFAYLT